MATATKKTPAKTAAQPPAKPRARKPAAPKAATAKAAETPRAPAKKAATPKAVTPKIAKPNTPARPKHTAPAAKAKAPAQPAKSSRTGMIAAIAVGIIAAGSAITLFGRRLLGPGNAEHAAPDLALDQPHPDEYRRAPDAFRPDPTAPVPASERDGLRPATASMATH